MPFWPQLLKLAQEQSWLGAEEEDLDEDRDASQTSWQQIKQIWQLVAQHPDPIVQSKGVRDLNDTANEPTRRFESRPS